MLPPWWFLPPWCHQPIFKPCYNYKWFSFSSQDTVAGPSKFTLINYANWTINWELIYDSSRDSAISSVDFKNPRKKTKKPLPARRHQCFLVSDKAKFIYTVLIGASSQCCSRTPSGPRSYRLDGAKRLMARIQTCLDARLFNHDPGNLHLDDTLAPPRSTLMSPAAARVDTQNDMTTDKQTDWRCLFDYFLC